MRENRIPTQTDQMDNAACVLGMAPPTFERVMPGQTINGVEVDRYGAEVANGYLWGLNMVENMQRQMFAPFMGGNSLPRSGGNNGRGRGDNR